MDLTRRHWFGLAGMMAVGAAASARLPLGPPAIQLLGRGDRDPGPMLDALAAYAADEMTAFGLPGLGMAVEGPDGLRATICLGRADVDRGTPIVPGYLFQIGSISKSMVALCIYRLADQGKLDLDAAVADVMPGISWPDARITIAAMLNHTSGLPGDAPMFPRSPDGRLWINYPPGRTFAYSNTAFGLLGLVVAHVARMPYPRALSELVLQPLGMSASEPVIRTRDRARFPTGYGAFGNDAWFPDNAITPGSWSDFDQPAGSVAATPADMARYVAYLVRLGRGQGAPLLSDRLARRFVTTTIDAPEFSPKGRYASGIATVDVDGRRCLHHTGGMILYHSSITVDWQAGGGVFASVNSGAGEYRPRGITHHGCRLLRAFIEGRALPAAPPIVAVSPVHKADRYAGRFLAAAAPPIEIAARGETLTAVAGEGARGRLLPIGERRFLADVAPLGRHEILFDKGSFDRFWWGGTRYARNEAIATPPVGEAVRGLAGLYESNSFWNSISVVARGDMLAMEGIGPLVRAADGSWRNSEDLPSDRLWFDAIVEGRAERLSFSGNDLLRFHDVDE